MKIIYYIDSDNKKNLYGRIGNGENRVSFSLGYVVATEEWNEEEGIPFEDHHYFTF